MHIHRRRSSVVAFLRKTDRKWPRIMAVLVTPPPPAPLPSEAQTLLRCLGNKDNEFSFSDYCFLFLLQFQMRMFPVFLES